ncbi:MAG: hypothetical protein COA32_14285 [Fluviicola sp.]|nr:MAG: hypothetical protein COA32_14285 [Fluviicola sp.]
MLEIKFKNSSKPSHRWGELYNGEGTLITDRIFLEEDTDTYIVEFYIEGIHYDSISNESIEEQESKIMLDLWEFDLEYEVFKIHRVRKHEKSISVSYFTSFYEIEKENWKTKDFFEVAEITLSRMDNIEFKVNYDSEDYDSRYIDIQISMPCQGKKIKDYVDDASKILESIYSEIKNELRGWVWNEEYEKNEALFTTELIIPLFRKLDFNGVRYFHGVNEFGKDVLSYKINEFGIKDFYAAQVKAGNISGSVRGSVNEIIHQIDDAFKMPFELINDGEPNFVSKVIIAISGKFTDNAQKKIKEKISKHLLANIIFLDKEDIMDLIQR